MADNPSTPPERESSAGAFRRTLRALSSGRAQRVQIRLFGALLFAVGALLTFNDAVFDFLTNFTDRPEILPVTLLVPYVYLIFQVVLWHLDRDEDAELDRIRYESRRADMAGRRLERRALIEAFEAGLENVEQLDTMESSLVLADWIAEQEDKSVSIDLLAYSSETFLQPCVRAAQKIGRLVQAGAAPPTVVKVRLLVRDLDAPWKMPFLQQLSVDRHYREALRGRFSQFLQRWGVELPEAFGEFMPRSRLDLELRAYPFEPSLRGAVVNGERGLLGIYGFHNVHHGGVSGWDYHGHGATLYRVLATGSPAERMALKDFTEFFDDLWMRHSTSLQV